jgi:SAM-dependent methyltransferase
MAQYAVTIFLSAFLLFQVQPMIAKIILPWFGGSAAVWTTCMLFFQVGLLAGYGYSHWSITRLNPSRQAVIHAALLGASLLLLPIMPDSSWKPGGEENPTLRILGLLAATVGLPYLLLSTTSPLLQAWYARTRHAAFPYRLFALSNLGSMLALLSYPTLVEPFLSARNQTWIWSGAYALFAALCAYTGFRSRVPVQAPVEVTANPGAHQEETPALPLKLLWVCLAAVPSMLMLAVTNHLTQDVAAIPFLWVLPLSIYLLSFILTFDARGWYHRGVFLVLLAPALGGMSYLQWANAKVPPMLWVIGIFSACLFVACMVCHGELVRLKPAPRYLTSFYLMLSIGGALGGLFVAIVAPYLFPIYFELPVAIGLCALLISMLAVEEPGRTYAEALRTAGAVALLLGVAALWVYLGRTMKDSLGDYVEARRNFYGSLRVREHIQNDDGHDSSYRVLMHGSINHGEQWLAPERRRELLSYYCRPTGIGRVMQAKHAGAPIRVGVLGLGAGTMAAFALPGDVFRFYEINPAVPDLARRYFTFLEDCLGSVEIVMGDGRLSLEREPPQNYDVLMMDAFSGDSIPVHLVTREAIELYFRHLKEDGILVVHISNKYIDLEPVLARVAESLGKATYVVETEDDQAGACFGTTYVLLANDARVFEAPPLKDAGQPAETRDTIGLWTDDFSNLIRLLK